MKANAPNGSHGRTTRAGRVDRRAREQATGRRSGRAQGRTTITWPAALTVVALVAVMVTAAACGGSPAPAPTVTITVAPSASSSASPSPSATKQDKPTAQLVIAVAGGPKANGVSLISTTGQVKQLVAPAGGPISDLAWAPDGRRLAFLRAASLTSSTRTLWVYNVPKKLLYQVAAGISPATIDSFAWVGATQLIESYFPAGATTYRTNGTLFARDIAKSSGEAIKDSTGNIVKGAGVSVTADGIHLAFVTYGATSSGMIPEKLRVYDTNDLAVTTVASGEAPSQDDGDQFTYPRISPDGALIATQQTGSDPGFGLTVYGIDGTKRLRANTLEFPAPVSWTSHGPRLAFGATNGLSSTTHGALRIWSPGESGATVIVHAEMPVTSFAWSPKASQIAYSVAKVNWPGVQSELWVIGANGANRHLLLADGSWPAWAVTTVSFP